jgi:ribosomal protein S18 acetylase RimI-like enzyme
MVSKNPGDGQAQAVMDVFLRSLPKGGTCFLKVAASNKRAICFYTRNGFKKVSAVNFGSIPGFIMKLNKF